MLRWILLVCCTSCRKARHKKSTTTNVSNAIPIFVTHYKPSEVEAIKKYCVKHTNVMERTTDGDSQEYQQLDVVIREHLSQAYRVRCGYCLNKKIGKNMALNL